VKWCAFAGVLLALCVDGAARAGDVPGYKALPAAANSTSSGVLYAGLSLGARWSDTAWTTTGLGSPPLAPAFPNPASFDASTARVGGYGGAMWRIAPSWVIGLEGDFAWGDSRRTVAAIPGSCCGGFAGVKQGWDGSVRGRFGYLLDPAWLLYATGGVGWQGLEVDASCSAKTSFCSSTHAESASTTQTGWTLGAGIEVMLRHNWLVRLEYRFADFGRLDHTFFVSLPADRVFMSESLKTQTLLVGLAYKLGSVTPAIATR
jgi:outer membrane immunogenic protein